MEISLPLPRRLRPAAVGGRRGGGRGGRHSGSAGRRRARAGARGKRAPGSHALAILRARPLGLRAVVCLALALPPLAGGWLWLRGSPLVAIRHVHVLGVHGPDALAIRDALDRAAEGMTTIDFKASALRSAVAGYPIVASVKAHTSFPHSIAIGVVERPPVAVLVAPGQRTTVAADGTVLGPALAVGALPTIAAHAAPRTGARVSEAQALGAAAALGAAPAGLLRYIERVYEGPEGLTLQMRNGLLVYFGDATLPHAKWLSLARVLASPSAAGALYVDVRLPSRPAAGFTLGSAASRASAAVAAPIGSADPTAATLAERLAQAAGGTGGGTTAPTGSSGEEEQQQQAPSSGPQAAETSSSSG